MNNTYICMQVLDYLDKFKSDNKIELYQLIRSKLHKRILEND